MHIEIKWNPKIVCVSNIYRGRFRIWGRGRGVGCSTMFLYMYFFNSCQTVRVIDRNIV